MNSRSGPSPDWFACLPVVCLRCSAGVRQEGKRMAVRLAFGREIGVRWVGWREMGAGLVRLPSGRVLAL